MGERTAELSVQEKVSAWWKEYDILVDLTKQQHSRWVAHTAGFLTVNTILISAAGLILARGVLQERGAVLIGLAVLGLLLAFLWFLVLCRIRVETQLRWSHLRYIEGHLERGDQGIFTSGDNYFKDKKELPFGSENPPGLPKVFGRVGASLCLRSLPVLFAALWIVVLGTSVVRSAKGGRGVKGTAHRSRTLTEEARGFKGRQTEGKARAKIEGNEVKDVANRLYWAFSTMAQTLGGAFGIFGAFVLFRLQTLTRRIGEAAKAVCGGALGGLTTEEGREADHLIAQRKWVQLQVFFREQKVTEKMRHDKQGRHFLEEFEESFSEWRGIRKLLRRSVWFTVPTIGGLFVFVAIAEWLCSVLWISWAALIISVICSVICLSYAVLTMLAVTDPQDFAGRKKEETRKA